ncbi:hypothetical protein LCGC14_1408220 [marine sediment metagenome]|uniref:Resolvase/invertase-type recombinase catalytic domain-containing protein n=1 Tax=marine sediment metagenome TaxID=412755 RepID=A0A0F9JV06_9ZZZZ
MSKITEVHLKKTAYVYIRQSSLEQVRNNLESQRRQYDLRKKAQELGWKSIAVIDEDQGKTGSGGVCRKGFEYLLHEVCQGKVGAIFSTEVSRLARNGREWHTLLEVCGILGSLIIDHDGIYDPANINDRLLLGMKGTISEMELTTLRQRSQEALKQKAKRGELFTTVAVGYIRTNDDRVEKDPDKRIQNVISLVFKKFRELASIRQVLIWFRKESVKLPAIEYGNGVRVIQWKLPVYNSFWHILTNPIYGGTYAFGRTYTKIKIENGQKRKSRAYQRVQKDWLVLIENHHDSYISWEEYQHNQTIIAHNANMKGAMVRGSVKKGHGLLAGLLRCGHCGRKLHVTYSGSIGNVVRYGCRGAMVNHGGGNCISFGGIRVDRAVSELILEIISPIGIEAALGAVERVEEKESEVRRQKELALEQACYEAERARRQFDCIEPENRLVASELEQRWNKALECVKVLEQQLTLISSNEIQLSEIEKGELLSLGKELHYVWSHENSNIEIKKRIVRAVINEIIASVEKDIIKLVFHWAGGDHTELKVPKNKIGVHRYRTDVETEKIIREISRYINDQKIANLLNRLGKRTGKGNTWTQLRVCSFRNTHKISVYQEGELKDRNEMLIEDAADKLGISRKKVYWLVRKGILHAKQVCFGAPWIIYEEDLGNERVVNYCKTGQIKQKAPCPDDMQQLSLDISMT